MKFLQFCLFLAIFFYSCKENTGEQIVENPEQIKIIGYSPRAQIGSLDTLPKKELWTYFQKEMNNGLYYLSYRKDSQHLEYFLNLDTAQMSEIWTNGEKNTQPFRLVGYEVVQTYSNYADFEFVYKFARNYNTYDGCSNIFWTPKTGILMERNSHWKGFNLFLSNDDIEKKELQILYITTLIGLGRFGSECGI
ncbi:MAG: hypothetical protein AAFY71_28325 [Bacteroidota bacterium]